MEIEQQNNSPSVDPAMIIDSFIQKADVIMVDLNSFKSFGRGESVVTTSVDWRPLWTQENKTELPLSSTQKSTILPSRQIFNYIHVKYCMVKLFVTIRRKKIQNYFPN